LPPVFFGRAATLDPDELFVKNRENQHDMHILTKLGLLDLPKSYFEFRVRHHGSAPAFRLEPMTAYFRESNASVNVQAPKNIEIVATFALPSNTGGFGEAGLENLENKVLQIPITLKQIKPQLVHKLIIPESNIQTYGLPNPILPVRTDCSKRRMS
jgi:hypothetical protein